MLQAFPAQLSYSNKSQNVSLYVDVACSMHAKPCNIQNVVCLVLLAHDNFDILLKIKNKKVIKLLILLKTLVLRLWITSIEFIVFHTTNITTSMKLAKKEYGYLKNWFKKHIFHFYDKLYPDWTNDRTHHTINFVNWKLNPQSLDWQSGSPIKRPICQSKNSKQ